MNASSLLVPSPFGRAFLRAPPWLQEALRHHGFGPHQSDGHVLVHTCLRPAVPEDELVLEDHPDFVDVGPMVTWTTTFGYILNTALTRMGGGDPAAGTTWKSIYRCWNSWPRSGEALTPLPILRGSFDGRSWTETDDGPQTGQVETLEAISYQRVGAYQPEGLGGPLEKEMGGTPIGAPNPPSGGDLAPCPSSGR